MCAVGCADKCDNREGKKIDLCKKIRKRCSRATDKAKSQERINYYNLPIVNATNDGSIQQNKFAVTHQSRVTKVNATASTTPIYHQVNKILMVELAVILMIVQITIKFTVVRTMRLTIKILLKNAFQVIRINQMKISKDI